MGSKNKVAEASSYPKKYWWLILVIVPLVGALVQYQPWKGTSSSSSDAARVSGNQFLGSAIIGNVSLVVNEAAKAGTTLDPALIDQIKNAATLSKAGDHDAAVAKIEQIRASSRDVGMLPSLLNNLGIEYLSAGKLEQARKAFEDALEKDPANKTALAGLGQLPDHLLKPLRVVNFSSQTTYSGDASNIADANPSTVWRSSDGKMPQSFVLELPIESAISELSFNDSAHGDSNRAAKDIEIAISAQSATAGFESAVKAVLVQGEIGQGVAIKPAKRGRWVKIRILSNYGNPDYTEIGDVEVIGRPQPQ